MLAHLALVRFPAIPVLVLGGSTVVAAVPKILTRRRGSDRRSAAGDTRVGLADLAARRLLLADRVAAAKFATGQPIDDPVREQRVLDEVADVAEAIGLKPAVGVRFFRDQLEASKMVQRALHAQWRAYPEYGPRERPDLAKDVRPQLDRMTVHMLRELLLTIRGTGRPADAGPAAADRQLDGLHRDALLLALRSLPAYGPQGSPPS
ncbi:gamma subclass chorismate mutase AroQ [Micromonospora sp. NBC_01796]|uniref:gamma subclass chorismate mutase AroQ n=1 Tax=Micromonospora sp. NBC_01796 TaxID=2975987 RepID=UPI002DD9BD90|nr:gamma subclass chorismate mutase AroQ [Micromonospora sp. NBC_01796]WSA84536.1 gamma subclass chorismate mutase AroQ [Micromonospora sp. NBC_01796]